jgi:hypothetical protein
MRIRNEKGDSKMSNSITISPNHGVNPSVLHCPICGESTSLALLGRLKDDAEAPKAMRDKEPCEKCCAQLDEYRNQGFLLLITDRELSEKEQKQPWLFFHSLKVITFEASERIFTKKEYLKKGAAWIGLETAKKLGLN